MLPAQPPVSSCWKVWRKLGWVRGLRLFGGAGNVREGREDARCNGI